MIALMTKGSKGMKRKFIKMIGLTIMYMPQAFSENKILKDEESYIKLSKNEIIEKIKRGKATVEEYKEVGINKITEEYLSDINNLLKEINLTSLSEIKKQCKSIITSLVRINEGNGTIFNYKMIGIEITASNLEIINNSIFLERKGSYVNFDTKLIKEIVLKANRRIYCSIAAINEGNGTKYDYLNLEISNANCENLYDFNMFLKNKNIQTPNKMKNEINRLMKALEKIFDGNGTLSNYKTIGINISRSKIKAVNSAINAVYERNKQYLNIEEIAEIVETISIVYFGDNEKNKKDIPSHSKHEVRCLA